MWSATVAHLAKLTQQHVALPAPVDPSPAWRILDLGGDGIKTRQLLSGCPDVVICDHSIEALGAANRLGYATALMDPDGSLPFADQEFDLLISFGLIEHATGPREEMSRIANKAVFTNEAWRHQFRLAQEIQRVAKRFVVQTPHRFSAFAARNPLNVTAIALPREWHLHAAELATRVGLQRGVSTLNTLVPKEMRQLFPRAEIIVGRTLKLPVSITAIQV